MNGSGYSLASSVHRQALRWLTIASQKTQGESLLTILAISSHPRPLFGGENSLSKVILNRNDS
jgi:hypothetical protein